MIKFTLRRLARGDAIATVGSLERMHVDSGNGNVEVSLALEGWRRRFPGLGPGLGFTFGAFQVVAASPDVNAQSQGERATLESLAVPDLPWSYIRRDAEEMLVRAIPTSEPRPVLGRATAFMIRWRGLEVRGRYRLLNSVDQRLAEAFSREVDPRPLDRAERLLVLSTAYVHPSARAQKLGLAMLYGTIQSMGLTLADAVVADPWPIGTPWDQMAAPYVPATAEEHQRAGAAVARLCEYYRSLGLVPLPARTHLIPSFVLYATRVAAP